ncbi:hypothetical protein [Jeotgalibacillus soli]|uniref:Yip1 domain-containing protein n=1 Tax=Jeotgalibacillus soli TaxID=889306 RepID=A0A0C2VLJ9_9BACL|nr:hypothetical protein [Jeotgalibacillus soli]KIL49797.1 hypothetical protein KP78_12650 [Jeotgalibacillus soli]
MKFRLFRGLWEPSDFLGSWKEAEVFIHIRRHIIALFLLGGLIFGLNGWIGIGSEYWSGQFVTLHGLTYDLQRLFFFLGRILLGLSYVGVLLLVPSLLYWMLIRDASFKKLVIVQIFPVFILLIEQLAFILLLIWQGINWYSSPLSWGVIAQLFIENDWTIYFLGSISIFKLWVMYWQFLSLRSVAQLKWWAVVAIILTLNIAFWSLTAMFATINFHQLLYS